MTILKGDLTSINSASVKKVTTRVDNYEVPYFLVIYLNGDKEAVTIKEAFVADTNVIIDEVLCKSIQDYFF